MLFFGCRRPDQDFIYADELRGFADQGVTELVHAFSRLDPDRKVYVQDCIREHQDAVWKLIERAPWSMSAGTPAAWPPA